MKNLVSSIALAVILAGGSAIAADKKTGATGGTSAGSGQSAEAGRGGLKEWPVSKEPADWTSAAPASTGASSGTSGSSKEKDR